MIQEEIRKIFCEKFLDAPLIVRSPGRINIIGEHTDYNEGFVLPGAIDKAVYIAVSKRADSEIHLLAIDFNEYFSIKPEDIKPVKNWPTYVLGVINQLQQNGFSVGGFNMAIKGDVPEGAGMSSSAALECAAVFALNELFSFKIEKLQMVKMAQRAEQTFAGVMCGIMDMFASMFGKNDQVIKLDCRSLEYEYRPLKLDGYKIVLFNTNVKHSLASSAYNERRQQCEQGVAWINKYVPAVKSLRDVTLAMLNDYVRPVDALVYKRCRYVVEEIQRLLNVCNYLESGEIQTVGQIMLATHDGLSKDYEVSCRELDFLVNAVRHNPAVAGARMMGGGFGGCTINIVKENEVENLIAQLDKEYKKAMGLDFAPYIVSLENGTEVLV